MRRDACNPKLQQSSADLQRLNGDAGRKKSQTISLGSGSLGSVNDMCHMLIMGPDSPDRVGRWDRGDAVLWTVPTCTEYSVSSVVLKGKPSVAW
ncbi:unnamed protein product [Lota lota]